ncbi:MAG: hypothetical protein V7K50_02075 [Nostoc sp.]|uniref:hypothetical protein n=1 Tax=Nostoc sp. TaxID=1180 RepID=UPI002FFA4464
MRIGRFNAIVSSSHVRLVYYRVRAIATTVYFLYCDVYDGLFGDVYDGLRLRTIS